MLQDLTNQEFGSRRSSVASLNADTPCHPGKNKDATVQPIIESYYVRHAQEHVDFEPSKHLAFDAGFKTFTMKELGFQEDVGVSPVAVSQPFKLFSEDAIQQMRAEVLNPEVMENCGFRSNIAACQIRGWAKKYGPFTYDAWTHPETLAAISKIAGVDLIPQFDYEIAHINFSVKSDKQTAEELDAINKQESLFAENEGIAGCASKDEKAEKPVVGWHKDSYPFVCVLMLSDCTNMVGGETALDCPNGKTMRVRGPQQGYAVVLQGRYINHQALRALGSKERITAVTSFRPRSAMLKDDTVLTTVRPVSDLSELYYDFAEYRLEIMEERLRKARHEMQVRRKDKKKFETIAHKKFLQDSVAFLKHTNNEIVEEDKVARGYIVEEDIPDVVVAEQDGP